MGLTEYRLQVRPILETFRVNLVDALRSGRARGEPAVGGNHLGAADLGVIAGSAGQFVCD